MFSFIIRQLFTAAKGNKVDLSCSTNLRKYIIQTSAGNFRHSEIQIDQLNQRLRDVSISSEPNIPRISHHFPLMTSCSLVDRFYLLLFPSNLGNSSFLIVVPSLVLVLITVQFNSISTLVIPSKFALLTLGLKGNMYSSFHAKHLLFKF